jgi:hypothetical protein
VQKVIANAVKWLKPACGPVPVSRGEVDALEPLPDALFPERLERRQGQNIQASRAGVLPAVNGIKY